MFVVSVSTDYTIAVHDNRIYVCSIPNHFDTRYDNEIDTYQMIDRQTCFDCSTENNPYKSFCDDNINFDYSQYIDTTFYYTESNITVNMHTIVNTNRFSIDDYVSFLSVFASDCLETHNDIICNDALFLASNFDLFLKNQQN
jgi:hypothetical protein